MRIDLVVLKYCFTQFYADSAKCVSNATVHSSNGNESCFTCVKVM